MKSPTLRFYERAKPVISQASDLPDLFTYHLTVEMDEPSATVESVRACYGACDLSTPSWLASHFSKGLKSRPKRFIKKDGGYRLEARRREEIGELLGDSHSAVQTSASLNRLEASLPAGDKRDFLRETISCFSAGANRAAVVMCWNLAAHHLQDHILNDPTRLSAFNSVLALNKDTRVKIKSVAKRDDFTEMSESKFLLFCREAKIVTASMFKKLENRLDERNGAAHPSGVKTTPKAAEAYIEDLVENVLRKFAA
jgi:hypothetical protein